MTYSYSYSYEDVGFLMEIDWDVGNVYVCMYVCMYVILHLRYVITYRIPYAPITRSSNPIYLPTLGPKPNRIESKHRAH